MSNTIKKADIGKCRWCKEVGDKTKMIKEKTEKGSSFYYHDHCHEKLLKEREDSKVAEIEYNDRDMVAKLVSEIYGIPFETMPKIFYISVGQIRHGNPVFKGKGVTKRYKQGYDYEIIAETYRHVRKDIEWANNKKDFPSTTGAINYGLHIVLDKIAFVAKKVEKRRKSEELARIHQAKNSDVETLELTEELNKESLTANKTRKKKVKNDRDISRFLN